MDERYRQTDGRQTTHGRATAYSEREREEICTLSKTVYLLVPNPGINPGNPGMGIGVSDSRNPGIRKWSWDCSLAAPCVVLRGGTGSGASVAISPFNDGSPSLFVLAARQSRHLTDYLTHIS